MTPNQLTRGQWSKQEVEYLRENYLQLTNAELAAKLWRSRNSISGKLWQLGLKKRGDEIETFTDKNFNQGEIQ